MKGITYFHSWREWSINEGRVPNMAFLPLNPGQFLYICLHSKVRIKVKTRGLLWSKLKLAYTFLSEDSYTLLSSMPLWKRLCVALSYLSLSVPHYVQSIPDLCEWTADYIESTFARSNIRRSLDDR